MATGFHMVTFSIPNIADVGKTVDVYIILRNNQFGLLWMAGTITLEVELHGAPANVPNRQTVTIQPQSQQAVSFSFIMPAANISVSLTAKDTAWLSGGQVSTNQMTIIARLPSGENVVGTYTPPPGSPVGYVPPPGTGGVQEGTDTSIVNVPQMVETCTLEPGQYFGNTTLWVVRDIKGIVLSTSSLESAINFANRDLRCKQTYTPPPVYTPPVLLPDDNDPTKDKDKEKEKPADYTMLILIVGLAAIAAVYFLKRRSE